MDNQDLYLKYLLETTIIFSTSMTLEQHILWTAKNITHFNLFISHNYRYFVYCIPLIVQ